MLSLGFGQGEDIVMNSHYQTIARVAGGNGLQADLHEFQIAPRDIAYITAFNPIHCDLTPVHGARNGTITDTAIQEIDIKTGLVRWEWHSLDHVGASESEVETPTGTTPWDWFHINSIDPQPDGDIFISARSTWAGYQLDGSTGKILWRLGGTNSSFKMGPGTKTAWQHDGRVLPDGEVTFFDDGANPPIHRQSRAVRIALDFKTHEAHLTSVFTHHDPPLLAASQGNVQTLADGNTVVGYGGVPAISEYAKDGALLFDAHQPFDLIFYRAFRFPWSAQPRARRRSSPASTTPAKRRSCTRAGTAPPQSPPGACSPASTPDRWRRRPRSPRVASRARRPYPSSTTTRPCRRSTQPATSSAPRSARTWSATPPHSRATDVAMAARATTEPSTRRPRGARARDAESSRLLEESLARRRRACSSRRRSLRLYAAPRHREGGR